MGHHYSECSPGVQDTGLCDDWDLNMLEVIHGGVAGSVEIQGGQDQQR